jgi:membrane protein DedA with SNARE-associated domain
MFTPRLEFERLKGKAAQLLAIALVAFVIAIILLDTLEDTLIDGSPFGSTPFTTLLNAVTMFTENVTAAVSSWGYAGIFMLMLLEASSLPIPSEIILPFSGYLVSLGLLNPLLVIFVATLAGIAGSLIDYYIGMKGIDLLTRRKTLSSLLFSEARLATVEEWFNKYGATVVFFSRLAPAFRTLVSFPAGAVKMRLPKFVAYTTTGCLVWNTFLIYTGVYVGANWREVANISHYLLVGLLVAIVGIVSAFLVRRKRKT